MGIYCFQIKMGFCLLYHKNLQNSSVPIYVLFLSFWPERITLLKRSLHYMSVTLDALVKEEAVQRHYFLMWCHFPSLLFPSSLYLCHLPSYPHTLVLKFSIYLEISWRCRSLYFYCYKLFLWVEVSPDQVGYILFYNGRIWYWERFSCYF